MEISEAPPLEWRILNDETQIASTDGRVVAIAYTVQASDADGSQWLEFCWLPVDEPDLVDVHFGVAAGTGSAWDTRWDRARKATEWEYALRSREP
ncbi:MAG: hypothetical protein V7607_4496 [Solirubrobacteraceae bacterium]